MNTEDVQTNRTNTIEDWRANDHVLFIGRRGSTTIGLNDANSDIDYLVVTDNSDEMARQENVMLDLNLVTVDRFKKMLLECGIETIETLYNLDYVKDSVVDDVNAYIQFVEMDEDAKFLFWYQIWLMLKNQSKQYRKGVNNSKFGSKMYLYGTLLEDENILDYWTHKREISSDVKAHYFDIRYNGVSAKDEEFIKGIEKWRFDNEVRAELRLKSNKIANRLGKANILEK